ncbi:hypothetical protein D3C84_460240 [compost metagenome]
MHVGHRQRRQLVRAEHAVDQIAQAVGLLDDDVGVVLEILVRQLAGEQLGGAANAAERVLDLVGQAAHQQLGGFLLGQLRLFLGDAQQPVARMHLQQQQGLAAVEDRRHRVIDGQGLAGDGGQHGLALVERMRLFDRLAQGAQGLARFGEQLADELSMAALAADGQEHFRRRIHVLEAQVGVEQQGGGGQVVEQQAVQCVIDSHIWAQLRLRREPRCCAKRTTVAAVTKCQRTLRLPAMQQENARSKPKPRKGPWNKPGRRLGGVSVRWSGG